MPYAVIDEKNKTAEIVPTLNEAAYQVFAEAKEVAPRSGNVVDGLAKKSKAKNVLNTLLLNHYKIVDIARILGELGQAGLKAGRELYDLIQSCIHSKTKD